MVKGRKVYDEEVYDTQEEVWERPKTKQTRTSRSSPEHLHVHRLGLGRLRFMDLKPGAGRQ
jgi:hypothetical protein